MKVGDKVKLNPDHYISKGLTDMRGEIIDNEPNEITVKWIDINKTYFTHVHTEIEILPLTKLEQLL